MDSVILKCSVLLFACCTLGSQPENDDEDMESSSGGKVLYCKVTVPTSGEQYCFSSADSGDSCSRVVSDRLEMTCDNGVSPGKKYNFFFTYSSPRPKHGLLTQFTSKYQGTGNESREPNKARSKTYFSPGMYSQNISFKPSDLQNHEEGFNIISQAVRVREIFKLKEGKNVSRCIVTDKRTGICDRTTIDYDVVYVSYGRGSNECCSFTCNNTENDITIYDHFKPNKSCKASSVLTETQIKVRVRTGCPRSNMCIEQVTAYLLSFNTEATTTTTMTKAVLTTAHSYTTVSEKTTDVTTINHITTPAHTTATIETNSAEADSIVVAVVVVGIIIFLLISMAAIVYKCWRKSPSSNLTPQPKISTFPNPSYGGSTDDDQRDYADIIDSPRPADPTFLGGGELGSTQHDNLTTRQASAAHGMTEYNEYNEIGEQDYNVLFGGKERGIYHQYTMIPDTGKDQRLKDKHQEKDKDKDKDKGTGHYQELLKDEISGGDNKQKSSEGGTRGHLLDVMEKGAESKVKAGGSAATADHVYQPLLKAAGNKSLDPDINLPTKSENECSDRTMVSAHKSLKDCGPEYATLEPDKTNLSLDSVSSPTNGFLSLNKDTTDPDDAVLERETSIHGGSDQPMDSTHQPLRDCGPEYATLEPDSMDTTNQSLDPVSSSASAFQSLNKDTSDHDYAVLEPETSINRCSDQSIDNTE